MTRQQTKALRAVMLAQVLARNHQLKRLRLYCRKDLGFDLWKQVDGCYKPALVTTRHLDKAVVVTLPRRLHSGFYNHLRRIGFRLDYTKHYIQISWET